MRIPLQRPVICLVTDSRRRPSAGLDSLIRLACAAAEAGVSLIQIREPDLEARPLAELTRRIVHGTASRSTLVVVNDRIDVALAACAHGVHLRADSVTAARARTMVPPGFLIGRSVHSVSEALDAEATGADYLIMGAIYPTPGKPDVTAAGPAALTAVCGAVTVPVLAIGGITIERLDEVARAGAAGVAAIGLFARCLEIPSRERLDARLGDIVRAVAGAFARATSGSGSAGEPRSATDERR